MKQPDLPLIEEGVKKIIKGLKINKDENTQKTHKRSAKALIKMCYGLYENHNKDLITFPSVYKGMVIIKNITVYSLCSHHLLRIKYKVSFGYLPRERVIGFGKIPNIIARIAGKPTLQEDFTQEIVDTFKKLLKPKGVGVIVEGKHDCITLRKKCQNSAITSAFRDEFLKEKTKQEFMKIVK